MLEALDETIKELLVQKMPLNLAEVDVSFDVPNREWSGTISKPTINVYLYDIRENLDLRQHEWQTTRNSNGTVTRTKTGQFFDVSYLITAWTSNIEDEHRLLWFVLATLVRNENFPKEVLQGGMGDQPFNLIKTARPDGILRNVADVWTALDNQLKPVIPYVVTLYLEPHIFQTATMVRNKFIRFHPPEQDLDTVRANRKIEAEVLQIGGIVRDATKQEPLRAEVVLFEQGLSIRADQEGRFRFNNVYSRPEATFLVAAPGYKALRQSLKIPSPSYDFVLEPESGSKSDIKP